MDIRLYSDFLKRNKLESSYFIHIMFSHLYNKIFHGSCNKLLFLFFMLFENQLSSKSSYLYFLQIKINN